MVPPILPRYIGCCILLGLFLFHAFAIANTSSWISKIEIFPLRILRLTVIAVVNIPVYKLWFFPGPSHELSLDDEEARTTVPFPAKVVIASSNFICLAPET